MEINSNDIFVFVMLSSILFGVIHFLSKCFIMLIYSRVVRQHDVTYFYYKLILLTFMILCTISLFIFLVLMCFFADAFNKVSMFWRLLGLFAISTYWGCFAGIAVGLKNVVGAGYGSATKVLKELINVVRKDSSQPK